jgi:hypothetical protein
MAGTNSPYGRSIGITGVVRWLLVVAAVIALGAALAAGKFALAGALLAVIAVAAVLAPWARRASAPPGPGSHTTP